MDKSYRIHTNIAEDTLLQVNMEQDFDFLEVLSLKLRQKDAYRLHSSNYGVIIGRVLANDAFGIPNAKLSIFIERDENDPSDMEFIYPYKEVTTKDKEGYVKLLYSTPAGLEMTGRVTTNYLQLMNMWQQRHNHRLPEWRQFCDELLEKLPLFKEFLITNGQLKEEESCN